MFNPETRALVGTLLGQQTGVLSGLFTAAVLVSELALAQITVYGKY